jgi:glycosyltransferase involved in cell wall biosynthesis
MRILMVTHYWRPHRGGIETVSWEQAHRLTQRGHQISVVAARLKGDRTYSAEDGFPVYRVAAFNALESRMGIPYPVYSPQMWPLLTRLVREHDVTLIQNHTYLGSVAATLAARAAKKPTVLIQYSPFVQYRFPWNVVERGADFLLGRVTLRSASRLMAISEHTRAYVRELAPNHPVRLLPLGVDTTRFTPVTTSSERQVIRRRLGWPDESFVVITLRRLVFRNGLDVLVEAATKLKANRSITVAIGGSGPERQLLQRVVQREKLDTVRLLGFVPDDALPDFYRAADAFVLPTRTGEGFGLVLLEAFASGIPAIATRGGGQEEAIQDGKNGILISAGDPTALAEAVSALEADRVRTRDMGKAARALAVQSGWERSVDHLEQALYEAIAEGIRA